MKHITKIEQAPRKKLMKLLDDLIGKRVIFLHAPAGFGKTVTASLWIEHRTTADTKKCVWIYLDDYDDRITAFCRRFVSALASIENDNTAINELLTHISFNASPVEFTLHALSFFADSSDEVFFIIDDLHVLNNTEVQELLPVFIKRLPDNYKVMLLSRTVPPESFSEMVIKEDLVVVGMDYLQFTDDEIKQLFQNNGQNLTTTQAKEILASTGGWAIGIRALLLSEDRIYNVDLTSQYLEAYLKTHVWEKWDSTLRQFMMLISVVDEFTPELCQTLIALDKKLKTASVKQLLISLIRESAFIRETGVSSFKFHDLFRDFLLEMLKQQNKDAPGIQYTKAGKYFYEQKDYSRAVEYYYKADNEDGIAESLYNMYDYSSSYASVRDTLNTIHLSVDSEIIEKHPFLLEVQAWATYVEGRADDFESTLDKYYKLAPKIIIQRPRSALILALLKVIDYRNSLYNVSKPLTKIPFKGLIRIPTPSTTQNMPFFHRSFRDLSECSIKSGKDMNVYFGALKIAFKQEFSVVSECLNAGLCYEKGDLSLALEHAMAANASITSNCSAEIMFCAMMILASTLHSCGHFDQAESTLSKVKEMISSTKSFYLNPNLEAFETRLRLCNGDKNIAERWLGQHPVNLYENLTFFETYRHFTTARAYIVAGDYNTATQLLQKLLLLSERYRRPLDVIESHLLLAIIYWKKGRSAITAALVHLEKAVLLAHVYGCTQLFSNEGADLSTMLHRLQKRSVQQKYAGDLPADFCKKLYMAAVNGSKRSKGLTGGAAPKNLTFTDKQKTVMHLMCEGYSRNEIAAKMGLKPNGVVSHTTLIYRKLDVSNSVEAVLKIHDLALLDL